MSQRCHRANAQNINSLGAQNGVDHLVEFLPVDRLIGLAQLIYIRAHHHGHHILVAKPVVGNLNTLHGGQAVEHHLLHGLLHGGVAVKAQIHRKTHHSGLGNPHVLSKAAGRHKGRLVIGFHNVLGNSPLSLGKARCFFL